MYFRDNRFQLGKYICTEATIDKRTIIVGIIQESGMNNSAIRKIDADAMTIETFSHEWFL